MEKERIEQKSVCVFVLWFIVDSIFLYHDLSFSKIQFLNLNFFQEHIHKIEIFRVCEIKEKNCLWKLIFKNVILYPETLRFRNYILENGKSWKTICSSCNFPFSNIQFVQTIIFSIATLLSIFRLCICGNTTVLFTLFYFH